MVQLESKLANANNLIEGLERQIDDLSTQKNDALVGHKSECSVQYGLFYISLVSLLLNKLL